MGRERGGKKRGIREYGSWGRSGTKKGAQVGGENIREFTLVWRGWDEIGAGTVPERAAGARCRAGVSQAS